MRRSCARLRMLWLLKHWCSFVFICGFLFQAVRGQDGIPFSYELKRDGNVSIGIFSKDGVLLRTITNAAPMKAGRHTTVWDGLDRNGRAVAPGDYTWKLINSPGIEPHFLMNLGISKGYWHWPGAHHGPQAVEVFDGTVVMAAGMVEGSPQFVAMDLATGKLKWYQGSTSGWGWVSQIAKGEKALFTNGFSLGGGNAEIQFMQPGSGRYIIGWANWKRAVMPWLLVRNYSFGATPQDGRQSVGVDAYDEARGFGWINPKDLEAVKIGTHTGIGSSLNSTAAFRLDLEGRHAHQATVVFANHGKKIMSLDVRLNARGFGKKTLVINPGKTAHATGKVESFLRINVKADEDAAWAITGISLRSWPKRIAVHGKDLLALLPGNVIAWIDPWSGKRVQTKQTLIAYFRPVVKKRLVMKLAQPANDFAVLPDGAVMVLTGTQLAKVGDDGSVEALVEGLTSARLVEYEPSTKGFFIVEAGRSQQIKKFSANGKLLETFGRLGGRRQGRYVAQDFMGVTDIAADGKGGFVVTEDSSAPRRVAHFDGNGKLVREWYGAQQFFTNTFIDPRDPTHVWIDSAGGWLLETVCDYDKGTWKPYATYKAGRLGPKDLPLQIGHTGYKGFHIRYRDGKKYLCKISQPVVVRVDEEQGRLVPLCGYRHLAWNRQDADKNPAVFGGPKAVKDGFRSVHWADLNGDLKIQPNELTYSRKHTSGNDAWVDENMVYYAGGRRMEPEWRNGVPVYPVTETAGPAPIGQWADREGNRYRYLMRNGQNPHGFGWPATQAAHVRFEKYSKDRKLLFSVGNRAASAPETHPPAQLHHPSRLAGVVKGVVGLCERVGAPCKFWTTDGLYVGHLFDRRPNDGVPRLAYHWWRIKHKGKDTWGPNGNQALFQYDLEAGGKLLELKDGRVLYFGAGWNSVPVYRLDGLDQLQRDQGPIAVKGAAGAAAAKGKGLYAEYTVRAVPAGVPKIKDDDLMGEDDDGIDLGELDNKAKAKPKTRKVARIDSSIGLGEIEKVVKGAAWPRETRNGPFSVVWSGTIEPRFSETYSFLVYSGGGGRFSITVDGKEVLANASGRRARSKPIALTAAKKTPIRITYRAAKPGAFHLCWESPSQEVEFVPAPHLYPPSKP